MTGGRAITTLAAAALCLAAGPTRATARQDTTQADRDSLAPADSSLLRPELIPMTVEETPPGPLAPTVRHRFTRTSLRWTGSHTLADLLTFIPGVYLARAGVLGQPEYVMYGGRGATSIELYWDGVPWHPLGGDSVYVDPSQFTLSLFRQVDVEVSPMGLRVYLISERHERSEPRSVIRVTSGSFSTAEYSGLFQYRWRSGLGLGLGGDFVGSDGAPDASRSDQHFDLWAKVEWLPDVGNTGALYQIRRQSLDRDARAGLESPGVPARDGDRVDVLFKVFSGTRTGGLGWRAELGFASSTWRNDSLTGDQSVRQALLTLRFARPQVSAEANVRLGDARVMRDVEGRVGWIPFGGVVLTGQGRWREFEADRSARWAAASVALYRGPFALVAQVADGDRLQAPAILTDSVQSTTDASIRFALTTKALSGSIGMIRRDGLQPVAIPDFPHLPAMDSSRTADYVEASVRLRPVHPLFVDAWYSHPRTTPASLQPPQHGRVSMTFRSKFWRTFRSGAFEFMLRYAIEYWSGGSAGLDASGSIVALPGATFHEWFVQFQLVSFQAFWNLRNARNSLAQYVPTLVYPRNAQTFGVKWDFVN